MRLLVAALALTLAAAPAAAQAPGRQGPPPPRTAASAPAAQAQAPVLPPVALSGAGLVSPLRPMGSTGSALVGLRPAGDPAPQCRSDCARTRYACDGDEAFCALQWTQCVADCSR